ncbi:MAG: hypothetical protein AAF423_11115 [Pseudomonadota bacterium]
MFKAPSAILLSVLFLCLATLNVKAAGCTLAGVELSCGDGSPASTLEAMASAETADLLANPLLGLEKFKQPSDLEKFRVSLEANWKSVNKAERQQRREMQRGNIEPEEFAAWTKIYNFARNNYFAGLTYYRTLVWHGKTGKAPPKS